MVRRVAAPLLAVFVVACADLVGIRALPSPDGGLDGGLTVPTDAQTADTLPQSDAGAACTNASTLIAPSIGLTSLVAVTGFVFAQLVGNGVTRCATGTTCAQSTNIVTTTSQGVVGGYGAAASLFYTLQSTNTGGGALHSASLDGTNDQLVVTNVTYPSWTTAYGDRAFWIDDPIAGGLTAAATLHCVGCGMDSGDQPWVTGLGRTYGVLDDVGQVYVLADAGSGTSRGVFACGTGAPCNASPRVAVTGLDAATTRAMVATDGTQLYVARSDKTDIERISTSNQATVVVPGVAAVAIAADFATNELVYATGDTKVFTTSIDGSTSSILLATCDPNAKIASLALDFDAVYALVTFQNGTSGVYAIKH